MKPKNYPFVSPELGEKARELGWKRQDKNLYWLAVEGGHEPCHIPLYQELFDWFEEKHRLKIREIPTTSGKDYWAIWGWDIEKVLWRKIGDGILDKDTAIQEAFSFIL